LNTVLAALLFVSAWSITFQYINFGADYAVRALFIVIGACVSAFTANVAFYLLKTYGVKFDSFGEKLKSALPEAKSGAPLITALILALSLPSGISIYALIITTIFAEFFGKLIFGGFGSNIFNPAAVGIAVGGLTFGSAVVLPDVYAGATPLADIARYYNWRLSSFQGYSFIDNYGGLFNMFLGAVRGSIGETARPAVLIAFVFLAYKKVIDWVVPVVYVDTVFAITFLFSLYICVGFWYPVMHILSGSLIFGAVFMATDPVTTPINRQGRILFAIFLAMITLIIRFNSAHTEAMAFSILIMNIFVPFIDRKTANITTMGKNAGALCGICLCHCLHFGAFNIAGIERCRFLYEKNY